MENDYSSGGWKKWVWLYVVIAVVVYGGVYYFVKNKKPASTATPTTTQTTTPPSTSASSVSISGMAFSPDNLVIKKGTVVTWTNNDAVSHTVTESDSQAGPTNTGLTPGSSYTFTFNTAGTFHYHCTIHPTMTGTVTVTD